MLSDPLVHCSDILYCHFSTVVGVRLTNISYIMKMMIIVFVIWLTDERRLALFPAGTIVRDSHHRESPTRCRQGLSLRRTRVQA